MPKPTTTDRLLESTPAIRAVARAILGADAEAEDVVQETCLAALRTDAVAVRTPARWLRGVARNLARRRRRAAARRTRREEAIARAPAVEPDRVRRERAELHRRLVHAVLSLPDPMRTAVLLRFFEGLPPREIAVHCGAPVETIRSRLKRAKAPGFAVHFAGPFRVPAEPRELSIALAPERPLLVRVVGTDDEGPVANAAIRGMFGEAGFVTGETDAAGGCRLRGWDGRSDLVLDVSRPGYYWSRLVVPAGDERTVEVRLRSTGHRTVRGRVTRSGRSPGVGVSIYARCPGDPERPGATAYTDEEGRFELSGLRGGDEYVLEATSAGLSYGEYRSPPVWFRADEGPDLEVPLLRTGHLAGLAVAPAPGESRAAVHVRIDRILLPDGGEPRPAPWLREFRPGRFAVRLPPGAYTVSVLLSGHLPRTFRDVRVKAGKTVDLGRVEFDPGGTAEATVRDGDGSALAAVEIYGRHEDGWFTYLGRTDESGRRTLRALRPGRWTILGRRKDDRLAVLGETRVAGRAGTAVAAVLATPGRLVVTGPSGAAFTVRADRPAPLDDLLVAGALRVWWPGTPEPPERVAKEPDFAVAAGGRTDLEGLAPGDYVVASGGRSVRVRVRPGKTTEVRLPLR